MRVATKTKGSVLPGGSGAGYTKSGSVSMIVSKGFWFDGLA